MKKTRGKRITWFVLTLILAMAMVGSSVFAAADDTTSSRMQNGKGDKNAGYLTLKKDFSKTGDTWPNIDKFTYKIEKVRAWYNSNESTSENGQALEKKDMPLPNETNANVNEKTYEIDNLTANQANTNKLGSLADLKFNFQKPGYYLYKVTEVPDDPKVPGVIYDYHVYYVSFYVANFTEGYASDGKTTGGAEDANGNVDTSKIYVHSITVYRSAADIGTNTQGFVEEYIPSEEDPAWNNQSTYYKMVDVNDENIDTIKADNKDYYTKSVVDGKDKFTKVADKSTMDVNTKYYELISEAEYKTLVAEAVEKVGKSEDGEGNHGKPNEATVEFWNETKSGDVEVEKIVTGTLGDLNKKFEFTIDLANLVKNTTYTVNLKVNENVTAAEPMTGSDLGTADANNKATFTAKADGTAQIKVYMKANQKIAIKDLPEGATYKVTEAKSDHAPKYNVTSQNQVTKDMTGAEAKAAGYTKDAEGNTIEGTEAKVTVSTICKATDNQAANLGALATATEVVDPGEGKVTVKYTNHRDFETETGIPNFVFPVALAGILALIALVVIRRKKNVATVNDFEF